MPHTRRRPSICAEPGCPTITTNTRCDEHERTHDRSRGTRQQRGYDTTHDHLRQDWEPRVATGTIPCWRCHELIDPREPWHLGHYRGQHAGPEHAHCNLSAAGSRADS